MGDREQIVEVQDVVPQEAQTRTYRRKRAISRSLSAPATFHISHPQIDGIQAPYQKVLDISVEYAPIASLGTQTKSQQQQQQRERLSLPTDVQLGRSNTQEITDKGRLQALEDDVDYLLLGFQEQSLSDQNRTLLELGKLVSKQETRSLLHHRNILNDIETELVQSAPESLAVEENKSNTLQRLAVLALILHEPRNVDAMSSKTSLWCFHVLSLQLQEGDSSTKSLSRKSHNAQRLTLLELVQSHVSFGEIKATTNLENHFVLALHVLSLLSHARAFREHIKTPRSANIILECLFTSRNIPNKLVSSWISKEAASLLEAIVSTTLATATIDSDSGSIHSPFDETFTSDLLSFAHRVICSVEEKRAYDVDIDTSAIKQSKSLRAVIVKILVNMSNRNPDVARQISSKLGLQALVDLLDLADNDAFDDQLLILGLLTNLVEYNTTSRQRLSECQIPLSSSKEHIPEYLCRHLISLTSGESKIAEDAIKGAYVAVLIGCIIQDDVDLFLKFKEFLGDRGLSRVPQLIEGFLDISSMLRIGNGTMDALQQVLTKLQRTISRSKDKEQ